MSPMSISNYCNENAVNCAGEVRVRTTMGHAVNYRIKGEGGEKKKHARIVVEFKGCSISHCWHPAAKFSFFLFFSFSGRASDVW